MSEKRFGRYTILGDLGSGGMGRVCRARDTVLGRDVALKLLHDGEGDETTDESMRVLLQEARAAAAIDHPNAVAIFDVGEIDRQPFLAMELIAGKTLREHISDDAAPLALRVAWLVDVANALGAAHRGRVLHRDIKPDNVIVRDDDGVVKVVDFGIARPLASIDRGAATQSMRLDEIMSGGAGSAPLLTAGIRGTPSYMAPEQLRGEALDGRADQFAWGILAYELLTGVHPWPSRDALGTVRGIASEPAPSPRARNPAIGIGLERIILRALEKKRDDRFASMDDLVVALQNEEQVIDESATSRPGSRFGPGSAIFAIVAGCMLLVGALSPSPPAHPRARAAPPPPLSANADALVSYGEGLQLIRDGSRSAAVAAFDKAATLDPTFAAAHLRAAMFVEAPDSVTRRHLQVATQFRNGLSEYELGLLRAFEAWEASPADARELVRRLADLCAHFSMETEAWILLGRARHSAGDEDNAIRAFDRAASLAPQFAIAWQGKASAYLVQNRLTETRDSFEKCIEISPASESCLLGLKFFLEAEGRCLEEVSIARRLIALAPKRSDGYRALANAIYGATNDLVGAREASMIDLDHNSELRRTNADLAVPTRLAVLAGDFDLADLEATRWIGEVEALVDEAPHVSPYWYRMTIALETNRKADAIALAREYLQKRAGWMPNDGSRSPSIYIVDILHRAGGIADESFDRFRDAWIEREVEKGVALGAWYVGMAHTALTDGDAKQAIALRSKFGELMSPVNSGIDFEWALGEVYRLAGDFEHALEHLSNASKACQAAEYPFQHFWSLERLGELFESRRNEARACEAYRSVVGAWKDVPSRTRNAARLGLKRLRCD